MDSCGHCMKFGLIVINIITFLGGVTAIVVGIWTLASWSIPYNLLNNNMYIKSVASVMAMGLAIIILALLGCCSAVKEVKCMLLTYYILVIIIFVVMLVLGSLLFVFRQKVPSTLEKEMYAAIPYYGVKYKYTFAWDETQSKLQCCGVQSYKDWKDNIPESCCREIFPGKRAKCKYEPNPTTMYNEGCYTRVVQLFRNNFVYVGAIAIVLAIIMILALIFSSGLFVKIQ